MASFVLQTLILSVFIVVFEAVVTIKMGILLSGKGWELGNQSYPAALIAIKEIETWEWDEAIKIETKVEESGCSVPSSYTAAHSLLSWGAHVIIGPACTIACMPVSLMAKEYNVPVISYACSGTSLSDKDTYPNFARTAESLSGASLLLKNAFKKWNFELYSIMTTTQIINVDLAIDFVTVMRTVKDYEVNRTVKSWPDDSGDLFKLKQLSTVVSGLDDRNDAVQNGTLEQLGSFMSDSWIFFLPMYDGDAGFILENAAKEAAKLYGVPAEEAWQKTNYAWFRYQSLVSGVRSIYYEGVFSLENDNPHVSFKDEYNKFLAKFDDSEELLKDKQQSVKLYLAYMYNAIVAWGTAYKKTGAKRDSRSFDYQDIIAKLNDIEYKGAYRTEVLNAKAEPKNAIWNLRQYQSGSFVDVVTQSKDDPNELIIHSETIKWPNGRIINPCSGGRCNTGKANNTVIYVVVSICVVLVIVVIAVAGFVVHRQRTRNQEDRKVEWKIPFADLDFAVKKSVSGSRKFGTDEKPSNISVARWNHTYVVVKNLNVPNLVITKEILDDIYVLKKDTHPNLEIFYGLCDEPGYCSVIKEFCSKGSLEDLAHNENVHLDWMFKLSLVIDVAKGLRQVHSSPFGFHGNLRASSCVVDSHWVCKVADFGLRNMYKESADDSRQNSSYNKATGVNVREGTDLEKEQLLAAPSSVFSIRSFKDGSLKTRKVPTYHLFYTAPEKLWPSSKERTVKEVQKCDTYSFAIVMYELFAREAPYDTSEILPEKIIQKIRNRESPPFRPSLDLMQITDKTSYEQVEAEDSPQAVPAEATELLKRCWREMPFERNNMNDTVQSLEDMNPDRSLSITDRVVKMMEKYSEDLENKVAQKTHQLQNQQAGKGLSRYLPKKVIERIENGLEVDRATNKYVTGACVHVYTQEDRDQIAAINAYEELNHTEVESRDIYQVVDGNGCPVVISGLYNEEKAAQQILEYAKALIQKAADRAIALKIAIHSGVTSGGLVLADTSNPRLCVTGNLSPDLCTLLDSTNFGEIILTEVARRDLPEETKTQFHGNIKLSEELVDTFLLETPTSKAAQPKLFEKIEPPITELKPNGGAPSADKNIV